MPQVLRESFDDTATPTGFLLLLQDRVTDVPVQRDQLSVDAPPCRVLSGTYLLGEGTQNIAIAGRQMEFGGHDLTLA